MALFRKEKSRLVSGSQASKKVSRTKSLLKIRSSVSTKSKQLKTCSQYETTSTSTHWVATQFYAHFSKSEWCKKIHKINSHLLWGYSSQMRVAKLNYQWSSFNMKYKVTVIQWFIIWAFFAPVFYHQSSKVIKTRIWGSMIDESWII